MHNTYVAVDRIFATTLWVLSTALITTDVLTEVNSGDLGILAGLGAAVVSVRGYVMRIEHELRNAFELGRDSVRLMRRDHSA